MPYTILGRGIYHRDIAINMGFHLRVLGDRLNEAMWIHRAYLRSADYGQEGLSLSLVPTFRPEVALGVCKPTVRKKSVRAKQEITCETQISHDLQLYLSGL